MIIHARLIKRPILKIKREIDKRPSINVVFSDGEGNKNGIFGPFSRLKWGDKGRERGKQPKKNVCTSFMDGSCIML